MKKFIQIVPFLIIALCILVVWSAAGWEMTLFIISIVSVFVTVFMAIMGAIYDDK